MTSTNIAILGAGPAGLMAAWKAASRGHSVTLFEATERVGGMAASFDIAGQRVDLGSHRLHPATDPEIMRDLRELLGSDLQTRPRNGRIRLRNRWVAFPLRTGDLITSLPPSFGVRAGFEAMTAPLRRSATSTFGSTIRSGLGPTVAREFYEPYATKLWGLPADKLDSDLARRRVSASSALAIVTRLLRSRKPEGRQFLYPRHGYGQICERLAEAATEAGATLKLNTAVQQVALGDSEVLVEPANGHSEKFDMAWSTIALQHLVPMLTPTPPPAIQAWAQEIAHRAMVLVYLVCDHDQYTPFDAHYFPGLDTPIARLSESKNYRDGPDPAGQTVLCAELACTVGDPVWEATDSELGQQVALSLHEQGLPQPLVDSVETRRLPHVYPVYPVGYQDSLKPLLGWVSQHERLVNFGRQGLFVPDNLHHILAMGVAAAEALDADGNFNHSAWHRSLDQFESHVVED